MNRDEVARKIARDYLHYWTTAEKAITVADRAHVQLTADGSRAFVDAVIEVEMPKVKE